MAVFLFVGDIMRFLIVLLGMFVCVGARAATMCMPDLSNCTSCTPVSYSGMIWRVNCCGVDVSGIVLPYAVIGNLNTALFVLENWDRWGSFGVNIGGNTAVLCVMTEPFLVLNAFVARCVTQDDFTSNAARICAESFKPKCVFSDCGGPMYCVGNGGAD